MAADQLQRIPRLIAHRGYAQKYPENSLLAVSQAVNHGLCLFEVDIQLCKDKIPVLLHDPDLCRVSGVAVAIHDLDSQQLANYSLSEPVRFGQTYQSNPFTLLSELVDYLRPRPEITALIEVKQESIDEHGDAQVLQAIAKLLSVVDQQIIVICYNADFLAQVKHNQGFRVGFIITDWTDIESPELLQLVPELVICNYKKIPPDYVQFADAAWDWALYEITDPDLALQYGRNGVKYVETMAVETMLANQLLKSKACVE